MKYTNGGDVVKRQLLISKRKDKKMSRAKLAEVLGVSESTIEKVEHGTRKASAGLAEEWAQILNILEVEMWRIFLKVSKTICLAVTLMLTSVRWDEKKFSVRVLSVVFYRDRNSGSHGLCNLGLPGCGNKNDEVKYGAAELK
jgi:transcriptional regulator with XRE-family HTH domain